MTNSGNAKRRFRAVAAVVGGKYLGVIEAASEEEAREKAGRRAHVSLCHECSDECSDATIEEINLEEITDEEAGEG